MKKYKGFVLALCLVFSYTNINASESAVEKDDIYTKAPLSEEKVHKPIKSALPKTSLNLGVHQISTAEEWNELSKSASKFNNGTIEIMNDLDFSNLDYTPFVINNNVVLEGNNHKIMNVKGSEPFIRHNYGTSQNINFTNVILNGDAYLGVYRNNYGFIKNINVNNLSLNSSDHVGFVARNHGVIDGVSLVNTNIISDGHAGGIAGTSSSNPLRPQLVHKDINEVKIINSNVDKINMKSRLRVANKAYRNIETEGNKDFTGDRFGAIVGRVENGIVDGATINNVSIQADDYLGSVAGIATFNKEANNKPTFIKNIKASNLSFYGGKRIGGLVGYIVESNNLNLNMISPTKSLHNNIKAQLTNSSVTGNFYISGYSELGGAVGLSYSAKVDNVKVAAIRKNHNIYSYYDEAAGLVADNEFGYISRSSANLNVYAKVFQAAGLVADNEGTIISSTAYGHVSTPKEAGGFVGSNLGQIKSSRSYGNLYVTTRVATTEHRKVKYKQKVKYKKKVKYKQRGKTKYKYVTKHKYVTKYKYAKVKYKKRVKYKKYGRTRYKYVTKYKLKNFKIYRPYYSGNFSAYNGRSYYKGHNLKGTVSGSSYKGKRYLNNKAIPNYAYGGIGK
ncbi:MAG: hypothetical protein RR425_05305 [Erysipelotrichales bacterium]